MIRLFLALDIPQQIKDSISILISNMKSMGANVKWVQPDNLHLTVKFLGNTEPKLVDEIISCLDKKITVPRPIDSNLVKLGGFPNLLKPKVIWIDIDKNRDTIVSFASTIDKSLSEIGFDENSKPFKPHLTLGRIKDTKNLEKLSGYLQQLTIQPIELQFDSCSLIKSTLTQQGPIYKTLHRFAFEEKFGD